MTREIVERIVVVGVGFALALIIVASPVSAQVAGPVLEHGTFEAGYTYKWFRRDTEPHPPEDKDWEVGALYVRYGLGRRLTITLEGGVWEVAHTDFPGMDYTRFTLGGGAAVGLVEIRGVLVSASYHYNKCSTGTGPGSSSTKTHAGHC